MFQLCLIRTPLILLNLLTATTWNRHKQWELMSKMRSKWLHEWGSLMGNPIEINIEKCQATTTKYPLEKETSLCVKKLMTLWEKECIGNKWNICVTCDKAIRYWSIQENITNRTKSINLNPLEGITSRTPSLFHHKSKTKFELLYLVVVADFHGCAFFRRWQTISCTARSSVFSLMRTSSYLRDQLLTWKNLR